MNFVPLVLLGLAILVVLVIFGLVARYLRLWVQSYASSAGIGLFDMVAMSFKKVNPTVIVRSKIMAVQAGLGDSSGVTGQALEAHYLAGGRVPLVVQALIAANKAKITELDFKRAAAIDLAGRNVREAVQTSVYPKVIDCPGKNSGRTSLDAVAKNGIQLKVKPLIGENGVIQMEIEQKIEDVGELVLVNDTEQPVIRKREANSFISVQDQEVIILGGLQSLRKSNTTGNTGLLSLIPIVNNLTSSRNKEGNVRELIIFLKPHVIKDVEEAAEYTRSQIDSQVHGDEIKAYMQDGAFETYKNITTEEKKGFGRIREFLGFEKDDL